MSDKPFLTDIKTIRERARQHIERIAIESYGEMIAWLEGKDPTTRRMLEGILAMEEEHADDLAGLLAEMDG